MSDESEPSEPTIEIENCKYPGSADGDEERRAYWLIQAWDRAHGNKSAEELIAFAAKCADYAENGTIPNTPKPVKSQLKVVNAPANS
jgi:hypothetical protein